LAFHLAAFWENIDHAAASGGIAAAAGEQVLFTTGDEIRVPDDVTNIVAIAAMLPLGADNAQVVSPSLRDIANLDIAPINSLADGNAEPDTPAKVLFYRENPIPLETGESLTVSCNCNPAAAADQSVLVWLADGPIVPVTGQQIHSVRCTGAITAVAGAWTNGALAFGQTLPVGSYAVVGFRAQGATLIAARLVFRGSGIRPGVIGNDLETDDDGGHFRLGRFGVFGEFHSTVQPTVDVLANDADTAQEFILDLVKLT
jgi:hypothetical protein